MPSPTIADILTALRVQCQRARTTLDLQQIRDGVQQWHQHEDERVRLAQRDGLRIVDEEMARRLPVKQTKEVRR